MSYENRASNPISTADESAIKAAETGKQLAVTFVSVKGSAAGTATLTIGSTIVWRGEFSAGNSDGQNFGEAGIKRNNEVGEAVTLAVTDGGSYKCNFGWKYARTS